MVVVSSSNINGIKEIMVDFRIWNIIILCNIKECKCILIDNSYIKCNEVILSPGTDGPWKVYHGSADLHIDKHKIRAVSHTKTV
jgi:hypothetical protein